MYAYAVLVTKRGELQELWIAGRAYAHAWLLDRAKHLSQLHGMSLEEYWTEELDLVNGALMRDQLRIEIVGPFEVHE